MKTEKYDQKIPLLTDKEDKQPKHDTGRNFGDNAKPYGEDYGEDTGDEPLHEEATEPEKEKETEEGPGQQRVNDKGIRG